MTARRPLRAILAGYGQFGCLAFDAARAAGIDIVLVLTHRDRTGEFCWWDSVQERSVSAGIPVLIDDDFRPDSTLSTTLGQLAPDLIISSFYRDILPAHILALPTHGAWNVHPSLLPTYRGRAPINWHLVHGESHCGLTVHRMVPRVDAGAIIAQVSVEIDPDQDAYGLSWQLLRAGAPFLRQAFSDLAHGTAVERDMPLPLPPAYRGRRPADGRIDWQQSARSIHNLVRAVAPPWPGATAFLGGEWWTVVRTRVVDELACAAPPGTILDRNRIACGSGIIQCLLAVSGSQHPQALPVGSRFTHSQEHSQ